MAIIRSPAVHGINEATRAELVDFGTANLRAENVRSFNQGEAGPRYGFAALGNLNGDGTTPTAGYKLIADRNTATRICDGVAQVLDGVSAKWNPLGRVPEATARIIDLPSIGTSSVICENRYT